MYPTPCMSFPKGRTASGWPRAPQQLLGWFRNRGCVPASKQGAPARDAHAVTLQHRFEKSIMVLIGTTHWYGNMVMGCFPSSSPWGCRGRPCETRTAPIRGPQLGGRVFGLLAPVVHGGSTVMECIDCHRRLRPRDVSARDDPGTLGQAPGPRCFSCYRRADRTCPSRAAACLGCGRVLRGSHQRLPDAPGTVRHAGHGLCVSCYRQARKPPRRLPRPDVCKGCWRALRGSHQRITNFPGTVRHAAHGLCVSCYQRGKRSPIYPQLKSFMVERRNRLGSRSRATQPAPHLRRG
jgi:hypothetical protein